MDCENKPNMKRTRSCGGQVDVYVDSDWWWTGGCICGLGLVVDRQVYMAAVRNMLVVVVSGRNDDDGATAA